MYTFYNGGLGGLGLGGGVRYVGALWGDQLNTIRVPAHTLFDAVGSKDKTLRVFTREEGGFHHCQVDNITIGVHTMWDWVCDVLKPGGRM